MAENEFVIEDENEIEDGKTKYQSIYLDKQHCDMAKELKEFYRAPSLTHAIRLAIEDAVAVARKRDKED